ncbi:uncharacterized protein B0I36DRAFT_381508 [Microdochium trichocladiopsis]|uniref:NADH:flavin oxidoreductase/NADH oxidase N-terminal domain-containing protein n=1 Tax=Microdochium trichocladiopsis TaxID=1682393 RepID=A0A9P9BSC2_9PEZI|nr:uncharacterized protein B0I36DRAFT_381508 [Microdochium trichocladiopsis]KAH7034605.1 hypothetical protein B0I36DRAFT_381508 [Microdochium trichocladiopsis]
MSRLFQPLKVGEFELGHRIMLAPLTRYRCDDEWVPLPMVQEYYAQRASTPGTLLITEATLISRAAAGRLNVPGIFTEAQISAWKSVVDAVHGKGGRIFCQLWHLGRAGHAHVHAQLGTKLVSASAVPLRQAAVTAIANPPRPGTPHALTDDEIWGVVRDYAAAARNAVEGAGFDGIEIHAANGYLPDQFLQDTCNTRTDRWGGSIENRARFTLEITRAVVAALAGRADKVAIRLSPFSEYNDMKMAEPLPQFEYLINELKALGGESGRNLAYLHFIEARVHGNDEKVDEGEAADQETVAPLVKLWGNASPVLLAGGFTGESARKVVDGTLKEYDVGIVFGRHFISNPDLVFRLKEGLELSKYDRSVFYTPKKREGYIDYPFSEQFTARAGAAL